LTVPNSFSPNGDGVNDYWIIPGMEKYPAAYVKIFNRNGHKVYEANGSSIKFDGRYHGDRLPSGVYYYMLTLSKNCRNFSGSLLIL